MFSCLLLKLNTKLQERFSNGWLYKRNVSDEFNRMPTAVAFVFNLNVKFTSLFGCNSLVNNTYYEIFLLLKATFFFFQKLFYSVRPSLSGIHDYWTAVLESTLDVNVYGHFSMLLSCGTVLCKRSHTVYLGFH